MTRDRLTILQVSADDTGGGAERVALDLHRAYTERGHRSYLGLGTQAHAEPGTFEIPDLDARSAWARYWLNLAVSMPKRHSALPQVLATPSRFVARALGHEDFGFPSTAGLLSIPPVQPDVMHLHNLHGYYFDLGALPTLSASVPTILTLHDSWTMAGHCAHPLDCERWLSGCGKCPYVDLYVGLKRDGSAYNWKIKRDIFRRSRLFVAAPSRWIAQRAERSILAEGTAELRVIPNGVDLSVFTPGDKTAARRALGLPQVGSIIMFSAKSLVDSPYKDFATAKAALSVVAMRTSAPVTLLAVGDSGAGADVANSAVTFVPFVASREKLALYYQAADIYMHSAKAETFSLTTLEAMACGIPVVASDVGGIPELVADGESGLLVPTGNVQAMAEALVRLLDDPSLRLAMGHMGAEIARTRFGFERQIDSYLQWYREIIKAEKARRRHSAHMDQS